MFDWTDYLTQAQALGKEPDEASRRSAISRSYYSVFNKAREMLAREGTPITDTGRAHDAVWGTLVSSGRGRRRLGIEGKRLREMRRKADYDAEVAALDKVTEHALASATDLNQLVDAEAAAKPGK